jgi:uncharacterized protein YwbE
MDPEDEDDCLTKAIGTDIKWKAGKNLTVHMVEKKQKKKGKVIYVVAHLPHAASAHPHLARQTTISHALRFLLSLSISILHSGAHPQGRGADRLLLQLLRPA